MTFPEPFASLTRCLAVFTEISFANVLPINCVFEYSYHTQATLVSIVPAFLVLVLLSVASLRQSSTTGQRSEHIALVVLFVMLPTTSTTLLRAFYCEEIEHYDGTTVRMLIADYSISCEDETHKAFQVFSAMMLIFVFPGGALFFISQLLFKHREKINPHCDATWEALSQRASDPSLKALRLLFQPYQPKLWFFEIVDLVRRLLMLGSLVFVDDRGTRAVVGLLLATVFASAYREVSPYASPSVNALSNAALQLIVLVYATGVLIVCRPIGYDPLVLGSALFLMSMLLFALAIYQQAVAGTSQLEVDSRVQEYEAREAELALSNAEMNAVFDLARKLSTPTGTFTRNATDDAKIDTQNLWLTASEAAASSTAFGPKKRNLKGFSNTLYPCLVMDLDDMRPFDRLPHHEEVLEQGVLLELKMSTRTPSSAHTFFVSHNWEGAVDTGVGGSEKRHPDNGLNTKLRWIQHLKLHLCIARDVSIYIWYVWVINIVTFQHRS